jgi:hypothetical protein
MVSYEADILNKNVNKLDFVSPSACRLFRCSVMGAIKTIIGTKTDFNTGSISMYEVAIKFYTIYYRLLYMILYSIQ